jgi:UDP-N-acetylglucosamine--N-acetylmuramyl-(pentapeptide) pyrophosphoryl-undecaprenol N-acetylglucosamine transferase
MISPKEVDQQAVKSATGMEVVTLPAVGLSRGRMTAFVRGFARSYRAARKFFGAHPPQAALAMGGFTSAPPVLAARRSGAITFLHESNTIPGRANRWLSRVVQVAFVGFPSAATRLRSRNVVITGTPVRPQFRPNEAGQARARLGLEPTRPVVLVMGGSQGASGINQLVVRALPGLAKSASDWQWLHLTGTADEPTVSQAYAALNVTSVVRPFLAEMDLALGAASAAVSRAGASSLAELAAMRLPALLVPYPSATDNHQLFNARAFEETGAARVLEQRAATPETFVNSLREIMQDTAARERMRSALAQWHAPHAAEEIASVILEAIKAGTTRGLEVPRPRAGQSPADRLELRNSETLRAVQ